MNYFRSHNKHSLSCVVWNFHSNSVILQGVVQEKKSVLTNNHIAYDYNKRHCRNQSAQLLLRPLLKRLRRRCAVYLLRYKSQSLRKLENQLTVNSERDTRNDETVDTRTNVWKVTSNERAINKEAFTRVGLGSTHTPINYCTHYYYLRTRCKINHLLQIYPEKCWRDWRIGKKWELQMEERAKEKMEMNLVSLNPQKMLQKSPTAVC